ncbi:MAG: hypothetical protein SFT91_04770 [Rickettsiaceae bacterium]|nr:hypothetical protein [Rickettsiaceae bacterium]
MVSFVSEYLFNHPTDKNGVIDDLNWTQKRLLLMNSQNMLRDFSAKDSFLKDTIIKIESSGGQVCCYISPLRQIGEKRGFNKEKMESFTTKFITALKNPDKVVIESYKDASSQYTCFDIAKLVAWDAPVITSTSIINTSCYIAFIGCGSSVLSVGIAYSVLRCLLCLNVENPYLLCGAKTICLAIEEMLTTCERDWVFSNFAQDEIVRKHLTDSLTLATGENNAVIYATPEVAEAIQPVSTELCQDNHLTVVGVEGVSIVY